MILNFLKSDWLKLKRTYLRWIITVFFILHAVFMVWYSKDLLKLEDFMFSMYKLFFGSIGVLLPAILGIYIGLSSSIEKNAGNFRNIKGFYFGKINAILSKNILVNLIFMLSIILSTIVFMFGINICYKIILPLKEFIVGIFCFCFSCALMTSIYIPISIGFSNSICTLLSIGILGSLVTAILAIVNLGNMIWWLLPYTYATFLPVIFCDNFNMFILSLIICIVVTLLILTIIIKFLKVLEK